LNFLYLKADFVVGNPPFIGNKRMRTALGDGYVEALRGAWQDVPETSDFVMYWWHQAGQLTQQGALQRFGFITTNSISQAFNRRVLERYLDDKKRPLTLGFAIPDHPWVDATDGAAVRIAMTVAQPGAGTGIFREVVAEREGSDEVAVDLRDIRGIIHADLSAGAKVSGARKLLANAGVCFQGMNLVGKGFRLEPDQVQALGYDLSTLPDVIKPHCNARDLMQGGEHCYVIDFFGYDPQRARLEHPALYQRLFDRVKPERDHNKDAQRKRDWWLFGRANTALRASWQDVARMILTPETSKHRVFVFQDRPFCPDHKLYAICVEGYESLGVLSSAMHKTWALSTGGRLGVGNDPTWTNTTCFATFPFPAAIDEQAARIRALAEHLDTHRKHQQAAHSDLTLTGMYNVLEKLRRGETLTPKERNIHEHGLVSLLRQLHDDLDAAVLDAYGWSDLLPLLRIAHGNEVPAAGQTRDDAKRAFDETILERLVALNAERAAEESRGHIRWLRPEFQNPQAHAAPEQTTLDATSDADETPALPVVATKPIAWPKDTVAQVRAVADLLASSPVPLSLDEIGNRFTARGPWKKRLPQLLEMLVALGRAEVLGDFYGAA